MSKKYIPWYDGHGVLELLPSRRPAPIHVDLGIYLSKQAANSDRTRFHGLSALAMCTDPFPFSSPMSSIAKSTRGPSEFHQGQLSSLDPGQEGHGAW